MEIPPFVDVFPIGKDGFPWLILVYRRVLYIYIYDYLFMYTVYLEPIWDPLFWGFVWTLKNKVFGIFSKQPFAPFWWFVMCILQKGRPTFQVEKLIMNHLKGLFEMMGFFQWLRPFFGLYLVHETQCFAEKSIPKVLRGSIHWPLPYLKDPSHDCKWLGSPCLG